jgi:4-diphosphocytidyl-2-C-methyl-D-erythritol kinase
VSRRIPVAAKINLALLVGERRADGLHEVATVMQRIDLCDRLSLELADALYIEGFREDTLVRSALNALAETAGVEPCWRVHLTKEIPVAAGLGGGSADAAAALGLANETLPEPLEYGTLSALAARLGSDMPFFLEPGPKLAEGAGERLTALDLPQDYWVVLALPKGATKLSTAEVYRRFDDLGGGPGFAERRAALLEAIGRCRRPRDLAAFPPNDLATAAGAPAELATLRAAGALRADVSGAGPCVYGLFVHRADAAAAARALKKTAAVWLTAPVW